MTIRIIVDKNQTKSIDIKANSLIPKQNCEQAIFFCRALGGNQAWIESKVED